MPFTEADLVQLTGAMANAAEVGFLRGMNTHLKDAHQPLWDRIGSIEGHAAEMKGAYAPVVAMQGDVLVRMSKVEDASNELKGDFKVVKTIGGIGLAFTTAALGAIGISWPHKP